MDGTLATHGIQSFTVTGMIFHNIDLTAGIVTPFSHTVSQHTTYQWPTDIAAVPIIVVGRDNPNKCMGAIREGDPIHDVAVAITTLTRSMKTKKMKAIQTRVPR